MTGHCDADVLAEFREGLLGRWRSARIRAHLARCPRCASLSGELADVTALLASAPAPVMPDELVARLDRVLAAESAAREAAIPATAARAGDSALAGGDAADGDGTAGERAGGADGRRRGRRRGRRPVSGGRRHDGRPVPGRAARPPGSRRVTALRAASVTAAVLVIAGGGYGVSRLLQGGGGGGISYGASAPESRQAGSGVHAAKRNAGIAQPGIGAEPGPLAVIYSGTDYVRGQLANQAETVLASQAARAATGAAGEFPANRGSTPATLPGCVLRVTGGTRASLVDLASYQGRPATVIMLETGGNPPGQVWVVAPGCSARGSHLIAHAQLPGAG